MTDTITLRDYFIAHAPAEPQPWFQPKMPTDRPTFPDHHALTSTQRADVDLLGLADVDIHQIDPVAIDFVKRCREASAAQDSWDADQQKAFYIQWPSAWADVQIEERGRQFAATLAEVAT